MGNWSQRVNRRSQPNRCLIRSSWRIVRAIDVFPIPPVPINAIDSRRSARPVMSVISSSRPKIFGAGGGDSPGGFGPVGVLWILATVLVYSVMPERTCVTYCLVFTVVILTTLQCLLDVQLDLGNNDRDFHHIAMGSGSGSNRSFWDRGRRIPRCTGCKLLAT